MANKYEGHGTEEDPINLDELNRKENKEGEIEFSEKSAFQKEIEAAEDENVLFGVLKKYEKQGYDAKTLWYDIKDAIVYEENPSSSETSHRSALKNARNQDLNDAMESIGEHEREAIKDKIEKLMKEGKIEGKVK